MEMASQIEAEDKKSLVKFTRAFIIAEIIILISPFISGWAEIYITPISDVYPLLLIVFFMMNTALFIAFGISKPKKFRLYMFFLALITIIPVSVILLLTIYSGITC